MDYITLALAKDYADQVAAGGGSGSADLKNYYKKSEVDNKLTEKVDKVEGKDLSTNDFTNDLKTKLENLSNYDDTAIKNSIQTKANSADVYTKTSINTELDKKVDKVSGKALSTNDYTTAEKIKLGEIAENAEVNKIDTIKVNGEAATITDKTIDLTIPEQITYSNIGSIQGIGTSDLTVTDGTNGFTRRSNTFSATASSNITYETTITLNKENLQGVIIRAKVEPSDSNSKFFLTSECTAKITQIFGDQSTGLLNTCSIGTETHFISAQNGDQIKITLECPEEINNYIKFSFELWNFVVITDTTDPAEVSYSSAYNMNLDIQSNIDYLEYQNNLLKYEIMPKVHVINNEASNNITLLDGHEYRLGLPTNSSSTVGIDFDSNISFDSDDSFQSLVVLKTGYKNNASCTLSFSDIIPFLYGDDVENNTFTPQAQKIYEMLFYFNGFEMNCIVKAKSYERPPE